MLVDILDRDERPRDIVSIADSLEPLGFGGEPRGGVQVVHGPLYARQFLQVVDGLRLVRLAEELYVGEHSRRGGDRVHGVHRVCTIRAIKQEGVVIETGDPIL